jgi:hypothetical protein
LKVGVHSGGRERAEPGFRQSFVPEDPGGRLRIPVRQKCRNRTDRIGVPGQPQRSAGATRITQNHLNIFPENRIFNRRVPGTDTVEIFIPYSPPQSPPPPPEPPAEWDQLGVRIQRLCALNENLQREFRQNAKLKRDFHRQMHFLTHDGLTLALDAGMQNRLKAEEFLRLRRELEQMEREKMVVWRKNYAVERDSLRGELEELQELRELHLVEKLAHLSELKAREGLEVLAALDSLEGDSIRIIVKESLRDAERVPGEEKK